MDNDISIFFDVFVKTTEGFRYEEIAGVVHPRLSNFELKY
jgi:hypothetical protein